jgi:hypothetical protein
VEGVAVKLNLSSLPTFGNMTRGGGLATLFDGNSQTGAWAESTLGWAGVDFGSSPQAISEAVLFSASNGFDASGSASSIRLRLYGKNGGAPTQRPIKKVQKLWHCDDLEGLGELSGEHEGHGH